MRILALEPYYGGSHKAFLDSWQETSIHEISILGLPPYKWKWRMRHASLTLAEQVISRFLESKFDLIFCSDMLNLPEWRGLVSPQFRNIPAIIYFHENQLTYPNTHQSDFDYHFAYTNFLSAIAADQVWFNSQYHLDIFLEALRTFLKRMPDYRHVEEIDSLKNKCLVVPQGIYPVSPLKKPPLRVPHILWSARWEHDKNPDLFFDMLYRLKKNKVEFNLSILGESFENTPPCFEKAKTDFAKQIIKFGFQSSRSEYEQAVAGADIIISTADHEFFGVAVVEAISAGLYPLLPNRLAYPEVIGVENRKYLYNTPDELWTALHTCIEKKLYINHDTTSLIKAVEPFYWPVLAPYIDKKVETAISSK